MSEPVYDEVIAVINSSDDTVEMLRDCLIHSGFRSVVTGHVHAIKAGETDFVQYLTDHQPALLVYDISIPYEQNWTFLRLLLDTEHMRGRKVVLTTTNKTRLEELVGATDAMEIVGKPYNLGLLVGAVKTALGK